MISLTSENASQPASAEELARARAWLEAERGRVAAQITFARRMSHDMSNYVTVVRTYSELLMADLPATGSARSDATEIHRAADGMIEYMHRMVRFARTANARLAVVPFDGAVNDVAK